MGERTPLICNFMEMPRVSLQGQWDHLRSVLAPHRDKFTISPGGNRFGPARHGERGRGYEAAMLMGRGVGGRCLSPYGFARKGGCEALSCHSQDEGGGKHDMDQESQNRVPGSVVSSLRIWRPCISPHWVTKPPQTLELWGSSGLKLVILKTLIDL